jgi:hypothetical protein
MFHLKNEAISDIYRFGRISCYNSKEYKKNKVISKANVEKQFISD